MTRSLFTALSLIGLLVNASGCDESDCSPHLVQYNHVQRVFMQGSDRYTLLLSPDDGQSHEIRRVDLPYYGDNHLFQDVLPQNDMWAKKYRVCRKDNQGHVQAVWVSEIHLHSAQEVSGGNWNYGKGGRGQTVVVE